jgi:tetratricopeptide (TPR) repeat protein/DNA-binding CsgD family transcriptional regulator
MHANIPHLRERLAHATGQIEKIDLMIELAGVTQRSDPSGARKLASKALRMARANNQSARVARSLVILGLCEYIQSNYPAALKRFKQTLSLAEELGDATLKARAHYGFGITYVNLRDFPRAMEALTTALGLTEAVELHGKIHNGIGMILARLSDYSGALEHHRQSLEIFGTLQDLTGEALTLNNMGCVYLALGDNEAAYESFARSNALATTIGDVRSQAYTVVNLGDILHSQGKLEEALEHYARGLDLCRTLGDASLEANTLSSMAAIQIGKSDGDLDAAFDYCRQALEIVERTGEGTLWQHTVRLGEIHYYRKEYDQAIEQYAKALEGTHAQGDRFSEYQILLYLSECHEAMGDVAEAFRYYQLHTQLKEEVVGQQQQHEMMQFRIRMEMERAEKEREILRLEKQNLEQEMNHRVKELAATTLHVVEKNEFLDSMKRALSEVVRVVDAKARPALRGLLRQVDARINDAEEWDAFEKQFELIHHDFIRRLSRHCPALTKTELKVCALVKLNLSTKDIAGMLSIATKTIEVHRYNIRRKLGIPSQTKLATYIAAF